MFRPPSPWFTPVLYRKEDFGGPDLPELRNKYKYGCEVRIFVEFVGNHLLTDSFNTTEVKIFDGASVTFLLHLKTYN